MSNAVCYPHKFTEWEEGPLPGGAWGWTRTCKRCGKPETRVTKY